MNLKKMAVISFAISLIIVGCSNMHSVSSKQNNDQSSEETSQRKEIVLTERQKELLEKEGQPLDYYELSSPWQNEISGMEIGMSYLEEKYPDDEFEYLGFQSAGFMPNSSPYISAISKKIGRGHTIIVDLNYVDGEYVCSDNYALMSESDAYAAEMVKFIKERYPNAEMFYKGDIDSREYEEGEGNILTRASGVAYIITDDVFNDSKELKVLLTELGEMLVENRPGESKLVFVLVLSNDDFKNADLNNYIRDYYKANKYIYAYDLSVNDSGDIQILER